MKLTIIGYLDLGISFDIDDSIFDLQKYDKKLKSLNYIIKKNEPDPDLQLNLGAGIKIDLSTDEIVKLWKSEAISEANTNFEDELLAGAISKCILKTLTIDIYSLGISYIRLDVENIDIQNSTYIEYIYQCFELSGYEKVSEALKKILCAIVPVFNLNNEIQKISKRFDLTSLNAYSLIPGFNCIAITEVNDNKDEIIRVLQDYERQYKFKELDLDEGIVHLGWAAAVIEPRYDDYEKILTLFKICQVFYGICDAYEQLFTNHLSASVKGSLSSSKSTYKPHTLNKLRTLCMTVNQLTLYNSTTNNISDMFFYDAFESFAKIKEKHERIIATSEIFSNIQNELSEIEENVRGKSLNNFIFVLTSLTFISVLADAISTVDYINKLLPSPLMRFVVLITPPMFLLLYIWRKMISDRKS